MSKFHRWNPLYLLAGIMILLPLYALVFVLENRWWEMATAAWIVLWIFVWIRESRKQTNLKLRDAKDFYQQQLIRTMNHYRHDWMNELQVLFGYIRLKKYEYLLPYTEKIREKLVLEGASSRLGIPALVAFLMTFRSSSNHLQFHVAIDEMMDLSMLPIDPVLITELISGFLVRFQQAGMDKAGEPAQLNLNLEEDGRNLILGFRYSGFYRPEELDDRLRQTLKEADRAGIAVLQKDYSDKQATVTVRLPFRTI